MSNRTYRASASLIVALVLGFVAGACSAAELTPLRVKVFPGAQNLAIFLGLSKGVFEKHGLKVELQFTANSSEQRQGLAEGKFEIAHAAVDKYVDLSYYERAVAALAR